MRSPHPLETEMRTFQRKRKNIIKGYFDVKTLRNSSLTIAVDTRHLHNTSIFVFNMKNEESERKFRIHHNNMNRKLKEENKKIVFF